MENDSVHQLRLIKLLLRKSWILILGTLIGALVSGAFSIYFLPKQYKASVLLYIWQDQTRAFTSVTQGDLSLYSTLISDYEVLLQSRNISEKVVEQLQMPISQASKLRSGISVGTRSSTRQMTVSVTLEDPQMAARFANTLAAVFSENIVEKMGVGDVYVIDPAIAPSSPVAPETTKNILIGAIIGFMIAFGIILISDFFDTTIRTVQDVRKLADLKLLGTVPRYERSPLDSRRTPLIKYSAYEKTPYSHDLVMLHKPLSPASEGLKTTLANIELTAQESTIRSLVITSATQREGKSAMIANLAIAYVQMGRRVLLVDADLRAASLHRYFGHDNHSGLTNVLTGEGHYDDYILPGATERLSILPSGPIPANPASLLLSQTMTDLVDALTHDFDIVLFDCPPLDAVNDAAIISTRVDATILTVRSEALDRRQLAWAINQLEQVGVHVKGFILTGVRRNADDDHHRAHHFIQMPVRPVMAAAPLIRQPRQKRSTIMMTEDMEN